MARGPAWPGAPLSFTDGDRNSRPGSEAAPGAPQGPNTLGYNPMRWRRFLGFIVGLLLLKYHCSSIIQSASQPAS